jgi:hypothetical protein
MHLRHSFDGVETTEFEVASCKTFCKCAITWMEFVGHLVLHRDIAA